MHEASRQTMKKCDPPLELKPWPTLNLPNPFMGCVVFLFGGFALPMTAALFNIAWATSDPFGRKLGFALAWLMAIPTVTAVVWGIRGMRRTNARMARQRAHPDQLWEWDYDWNRQRSFDRVRNRGRNLLLPLVICLPWLILINTSFTHLLDEQIRTAAARTGYRVLALAADAAWLYFAVRCVYLISRRLKFGALTLRYREFPFYTGQAAQMAMEAGDWLLSAEMVQATLRLVEIRRATRRILFTRYREHAFFQSALDITFNAARTDGLVQLPMRFEIPADAPETDFSTMPPRYWDLEVHVQTAGVDYRGHFLMPIYREHRRTLTEIQ